MHAMTANRFRATALLATLGLSACAGFRDALTRHVDLVARAGAQELSVARLAQLMTTAKVPPRKDVALAITNLWVNYQLLAAAAAKGDTLADNSAIDDAMWAQIAQLKSRKFYDAVQKSFPAPDSSTFERKYNEGELMAARHILLMVDRNLAKPAQVDSVRREAEKVRRQLTPANFAKMAEKYTQDPGSKSTGGEYVFGSGRMVPEFEQGVRALKPGEISGLVQTQYGFHILMRETWEEARAPWSAAYRRLADSVAGAAFFDGIDKNAAVEVKPGAAKMVKAIGEDVDAHRDDGTVLATSRGGKLTAARMARWVASMPPQMRVRDQIAQAPDSVMPIFVRNVMRQELVLRAADSAKITLDTAEVNGIRRGFTGSLTSSMSALNIAPAQLKDSAKSASERARLASGRVDAYVEKLLRNEVQFVDVSEPIALALRKKYESRVVTAGLERAVPEAVKLAAQADSQRAKSLPSSVVPMPGVAPPPAVAAPPGPKPESGAKAKAAPARKS